MDGQEEFDEEIVDLYNRYMLQYETYRTFYPPTFDNRKITSLLELIIILPLLDIYELYDAYSRISGMTYCYEEYISKLLEFAWEDVPESAEKRFVEVELSKIRQIREGKDPYDDEDNPVIWDKEGYLAYRDLIRKKEKYIDRFASLTQDNPFFV